MNTYSLKEYLEYLGDKAAGNLFGVSRYTARSWRLGNRTPRTNDIPRMIAISGGKLTLQSFFQDREITNMSGAEGKQERK